MKYINLCPHPVAVYHTPQSSSPHRLLEVCGYLRLDYEDGSARRPPGDFVDSYGDWRPVQVAREVLLRLHRDAEDIQEGDVLVVSAIVGVSDAAERLAQDLGVFVVSPGRALWRGNKLVGCVGLRHWASPPSNTAGD